MGYTLDEFIGLAGFDPQGTELDRIGCGGAGGLASDTEEASGGSGGNGLVIVKSYAEESRPIQVDVFRHDGQSSIRPKGETETPGMELP